MSSPRILTALLILLPLPALISCGQEPEASSPDTAVVSQAAHATVDVPGTITGPAGDTLSAAPGERILIYYWIPMNLQTEAEDDLVYLSSLPDSIARVVPVQPDPDSRNLAQTIVNDLGIVLPVYLADPAAMSSMDASMLPSAVLLSPGGGSSAEFGFGAPARLLSSR